MQHTITITRSDAEKIRDLINQAAYPRQESNRYLNDLAAELDRAHLVDPGEVPPDVITMNSRADLRDLETGEVTAYTLVFPEAADALHGKISVLAPIGTAMLGYREGETFEWDTPDGVRRLRVEKVLYQPEAAGDE